MQPVANLYLGFASLHLLVNNESLWWLSGENNDDASSPNKAAL